VCESRLPEDGGIRFAIPPYAGYGLKRLVWYEVHESIVVAIQREKTMKHWPRRWNVRLILALNPEWDDLYETLM
jgi:predicted GIY-YIG superfamily endonuclease